MPLKKSPDDQSPDQSLALLDPEPEAQTVSETPPEPEPAVESESFAEPQAATSIPRPWVPEEWFTRRCQNYALHLSVAIKPLEAMRSQFLASIAENSGHGHFPVTPTADDISALLREHASAPDVAASAAIDAWIGSVAAESADKIRRIKEAARLQAIEDAKRAREQESRRRAEKERRMIMERSEWEKQDVLAREAEARKWTAYAAQEAEYANWKSRTGADSQPS